MRELVLRVPAGALDEILDRLLALAPGGVRERDLDGRRVELLMRGPELPSLGEIAAAVAPRPYTLSEREVSDDWRERRLADYVPDTIDGRMVVRPDWAPPAPQGMIDIELAQSAAFGQGTHPSTRGCLELLLSLEPAGSFADLGCGSGVLAIAAARLGWSPVTALDTQAASIDATRENALLNGARVDAAARDLRVQPPPPADGFAANMPAAVHASIAAGWSSAPPRVGLISGFGPAVAPAVISAYRGCGLRERRRLVRFGWVIAELERA